MEGQSYPSRGPYAAASRQTGDAEKPVRPGTSQPHNAKKEALGPNTNR